MNKRILITGASTYGVKNHGDDAMLATLISGLKQDIPGAELDFLCRHPDPEYDDLFGFTSIKNVDHDSSEEAKGRFFNGFNAGDERSGLLKIVKTIEQSDLIIIGGNSLMELRENEFLRGVSSYATLIALWAISYNKPYALFGLNIVGPIEGQLTQKHAKFLIENAELVTAREDHVIKYLTDVNISCRNVKVCGDPAFGLTLPRLSQKASGSREKLLRWRDKEKILIGLNYRIEYWSCSKERREFIIERLAQVTEKIIEKNNAQFLFIPNCTYSNGDRWQDDRLTNHKIFNHLDTKYAKDVFLIEEEQNVFETANIFSYLNFHITNRRHSAIFAALNGVPFCLYEIGLKSHIAPLFSELKLDAQCVSIDHTVGEQVSQINEYISKSGDIVKCTDAALPSLVQKAKDQVRLISDLVR